MPYPFPERDYEKSHTFPKDSQDSVIKSSEKIKLMWVFMFMYLKMYSKCKHIFNHMQR